MRRLWVNRIKEVWSIGRHKFCLQRVESRLAEMPEPSTLYQAIEILVLELYIEGIQEFVDVKQSELNELIRRHG